MFGNLYLPNTQYRILYNGRCHVQPRSIERHRKILLVGMSFPNEIRQQWSSNIGPLAKAIIYDDPFLAMTLPALDKFTHISVTTQKPRHYSDSVKRDF